jgi:hypothetical protein
LNISEKYQTYCAIACRGIDLNYTSRLPALGRKAQTVRSRRMGKWCRKKRNSLALSQQLLADSKENFFTFIFKNKLSFGE